MQLPEEIKRDIFSEIKRFHDTQDSGTTIHHNQKPKTDRESEHEICNKYSVIFLCSDEKNNETPVYSIESSGYRITMTFHKEIILIHAVEKNDITD